MYFLLSLISFVLLVGTIIAIVFVLRTNMYNDAKTQDQCKQQTADCQSKSQNCCGVWKDNACFKGTISNGMCIHKGSTVMRILVGVAALFVLLAIVFLILGFVYKQKKPMSFRFY